MSILRGFDETDMFDHMTIEVYNVWSVDGVVVCVEYMTTSRSSYQLFCTSFSEVKFVIDPIKCYPEYKFKMRTNVFVLKKKIFVVCYDDAVFVHDSSGMLLKKIELQPTYIDRVLFNTTESVYHLVVTPEKLSIYDLLSTPHKTITIGSKFLEIERVLHAAWRDSVLFVLSTIEHPCGNSFRTCYMIQKFQFNGTKIKYNDDVVLIDSSKLMVGLHHDRDPARVFVERVLPLSGRSVVLYSGSQHFGDHGYACIYDLAQNKVDVNDFIKHRHSYYEERNDPCDTFFVAFVNNPRRFMKFTMVKPVIAVTTLHPSITHGYEMSIS